jgi:hypothetical protein
MIKQIVILNIFLFTTFAFLLFGEQKLRSDLCLECFSNEITLDPYPWLHPNNYNIYAVKKTEKILEKPIITFEISEDEETIKFNIDVGQPNESGYQQTKILPIHLDMKVIENINTLSDDIPIPPSLSLIMESFDLHTNNSYSFSLAKIIK